MRVKGAVNSLKALPGAARKVKKALRSVTLLPMGRVEPLKLGVCPSKMLSGINDGGRCMFREIQPEDLILQSDDGSKRVNHGMVREFGLFNLNQDLQEELLGIYLHNAKRHGPRDKFRVTTYITLVRNINLFPFPVITNFTSGPAYEYNMRMLEPYAG